MSPPPLRLRRRALPDLPPLAWLAILPPGGAGDVLVYHGTAVEWRDTWLAAGTWDGEFAAGDFHTSAHFFGSGLRIEGDAVYASPSSAPLNRLVYCQHRGRWLVANSLPLLLASTGARLDPAHDYRRETYAARAGAGAYDKTFAIRHAEIAAFGQVSGETLVLRDGAATFASPGSAPAVQSFARYRDLVAATLERLRRNYTSAERRAPMAAYVAMSSGYDSAASAVLVKDLDIEACFTARRSNSHTPAWWSRRATDDDGTPIARRLGLRTVHLDARASAIGEDEAYFLAPGCAPAMLAWHALARHLEASRRPAVVFTGFLGDEMWDTDPKERAYAERGLVRGDPTALMVSEIELKAGFTCVAVPSLLHRAARGVSDLTASEEMAAWRVGGRYDRPIPRRVLDEAGVPAALFAQRKRAVVSTRTFPANRSLRRDFFASVRRDIGWGPLRILAHGAANRAAFWCYRGWHVLRRLVTGARLPKTPAVLIGPRVDLAYAMFPWACARLSDHLTAVLAAAHDGHRARAA